MLTKVKFAFVGAGLAALAGFFTVLETSDWKAALPAAVLPFLAPAFAYVKGEGYDTLKSYLISKGWYQDETPEVFDAERL